MSTSFFGRFTEKSTSTFWWGMTATTITLFSLLAIGAWLSWSNTPLTWIVCGAGYVAGIPLGMLLSPHKEETGNFRTIGAYFATFISGYVASRIAGVNVTQLIANTVGNPLRSGRVLLFISFFILGLVQTYFVRAYLDKTLEMGSVGSGK